eukprot:516057_1
MNNVWYSILIFIHLKNFTCFIIFYDDMDNVTSSGWTFAVSKTSTTNITNCPSGGYCAQVCGKGYAGTMSHIFSSIESLSSLQMQFDQNSDDQGCVVQYKYSNQVNYITLSSSAGLIQNDMHTLSDPSGATSVTFRFSSVWASTHKQASHHHCAWIDNFYFMATSNAPTSVPTEPTNNPTSEPTYSPTYYPTPAPTTPSPTLEPTLTPIMNPSHEPTLNPTFIPTSQPSVNPTLEPTLNPSLSPTIPTNIPSKFPSQSPTQFTNSPTNNPTFDPTDDPTNNPTTNPTDNPTSDPTTTPTTAPTSTPTNAPLSVAEWLDLNVENTSDKYDPFFYAGLACIALLLLMTAVAYKKCIKHDHIQIDDQRYLNVFEYFMQLFDLYTDFKFAYQLYEYYSYSKFANTDIPQLNTNTFYILFILSMTFTIIPYMCNFASSVRIVASISNDVNYVISPYSKQYFVKKSVIYSVAVLLTGGSFPALELINSNFLSLSVFSAGLSNKQILSFVAHKVWLTTFCENIPQLLIQSYFMFELGLITVTVVLSLIFSVFSILLTMLLALMSCSIQSNQKELPFVITLEVKNPNATKELGQIKALSKALNALSPAKDAMNFEVLVFWKSRRSLYGVVSYTENVENVQSVLNDTSKIRSAVKKVFGEHFDATCQYSSNNHEFSTIIRDNNNEYKDLLTKWNFEGFMDVFQSEGWTNPKYWDSEHLTNDVLTNDIGFKKGHIVQFREEYDKWALCNKNEVEMLALENVDHIHQ